MKAWTPWGEAISMLVEEELQSRLVDPAQQKGMQLDQFYVWMKGR